MIQKTQSKAQEVSDSPRIVACIPTFNEENHIGPVVLRSSAYVDRVIVCDDGSSDLTGQIAAMMGATVITHERNMGYGAALRSLLDEAVRLGVEIAVTLDGDGQHDPSDIPQIVNQMYLSDSDIVLGSRFMAGVQREVPSWRAIGIRLITGMVSTDKMKLTDAQSGIRAYNRRALESLIITEKGMGASTEILLKASEIGLRVSEVQATVRYAESSSTQNPVTHGLDVVLTTLKYISINRPLLFFGLPGFVSILISMFFWIWTFNVFTQTRMIITNVALIAVGTAIVGLMLMTTAVILWTITSVIKERIK